MKLLEKFYIFLVECVFVGLAMLILLFLFSTSALVLYGLIVYGDVFGLWLLGEI